MAEIAPMERLQPCLLDRLTDDEPEVTREGRDQHVVSMRKYRNAVLRDIEVLFNSRAYPLNDMLSIRSVMHLRSFFQYFPVLFAFDKPDCIAVD